MHLGVIPVPPFTKGGPGGILFLALAACSPAPPVPEPLPSILLVTLDTTRADSTGLETDRVATPHLEALAARGIVFTQAYTTAPMTLPAHASMLTGLYPSEHGIHENARYLAEDKAVLAGRLAERGYATAAFVSGLPLSRQFGLARGFEHYDDDFGDAAERRAAETTDRVLAFLDRTSASPLFLWVHYFDPHEPYDPPAPFDAHPDPYLGEIASMDGELGRLVGAFERRFAARRILVAGDHGEGRGDHGEALHGNLLYQGVMRVPLIVAGGVAAGRRDEPVSVRRAFDTVLAWAGLERAATLLDGSPEVVLGEAMQPHLQYGWQPQVMAVRGGQKVIRSGEIEVYDVGTDPAETRNLAGETEIDGELREAIRAYPLPAASEPVDLSRDEREKLAALGYAAGLGVGAAREGGPSPKDMAHLFAALDAGSGLFVREEYGEAIAVFTRVLEEDPENLAVCLRLAAAHSVLGHGGEAAGYFERARELAPDSADVRHYHAMHYFRSGQWEKAEPLFASVLARTPERVPALERLAEIRERQGRPHEAIELLERVVALKRSPVAELLKLGELRMAVADTPEAIRAFERARDLDPAAFVHPLELGVLYLAERRLDEAADCLDRVPPGAPDYPMALFKRAQVAVLRGEPDREDRIRLAWREADETTRPLIERERLFEGVALR